MLEGRCPAYGEGITFLPLREVVLQALAGRPAGELAATLGIPAVAVRRVAAAVGLEHGEAGEDTVGPSCNCSARLPARARSSS